MFVEKKGQISGMLMVCNKEIWGTCCSLYALRQASLRLSRKTHLFSGFLIFSHIFPCFLIFSHVFSHFLMFSHHLSLATQRNGWYPFRIVSIDKGRLCVILEHSSSIAVWLKRFFLICWRISCEEYLQSVRYYSFAENRQKAKQSSEEPGKTLGGQICTLESN